MIRPHETDEDMGWLLITLKEHCPWCEKKTSKATRKKLKNPPYHDDCYEQHFMVEAEKRSGAIHG